MPLIPFEQLPDRARLWAFAASRPLNPEESAGLLAATDEFLAGWTAHRVPLATARELRFNQFLFVAVDEEAAGASGCSIDALVRFMRQAEGQLDVRLTDNGLVWFRVEGGQVRCVPRAEFQRLVDDGTVGAETMVFEIRSRPPVPCVRAVGKSPRHAHGTVGCSCPGLPSPLGRGVRSEVE